MAKLIMMVGLPSSGKSTFAFIKGSFSDNVKVHASDELRLEMFGKLDQTKNDELFQELHKRIKADLSAGYDVYYDATNVSRKKRVAFLKEINYIDCEKVAYLMATPYKLCLEQNKLRVGERRVCERVIRKMYLNFQIPQLEENFDKIEIHYHPKAEEYTDKMDVLFSRLDKIDQETPFHNYTIGKHCYECSRELMGILTKTFGIKEVAYNTDMILLMLSAGIHDIGKEFTKTYNEEKGHCTYYQHHLTGAYDSVFISKYNMGLTTEQTLKVAKYISFHMQPFFSKTEKAIKKFKSIVGEKDYELILMLHEADKLAK